MEVRAHVVGRRTSRPSRIVFGLALCAAACSTSDREPGRGDPGGAPSDPSAPSGDVFPAEAGVPRVGHETRLDSALDRLHFTFRAQGGRFVAGHVTHAASVERGALRFTPNRPGEGRPAAGSSIQLETHAIRRGEAVVDVGYRAAAVDRATGRLRVTRGQVVEEIRNDERGVEQSWRFETAPGADGDLVVEVAVSGPRYLSSTEGGLHFGGGELGLRYSHATWIDANGVAVPIRALYHDGLIRMRVPQDVLSGSAFPAVLDPTIGAETAVDQPVVGWTGAAARHSAIAASPDGDQALVVWQDNRNGPQSDIYGARLGAAGQLLDPVGIAVSTDGGVQDNPTVAFAGGVYVVAWQEAGNIRAARVDPASGAVTQLGNVAATGASETLPRLASRGATALLVYESDEDVRAAQFNGASFGATFNVVNSAAPEREPEVAADPNGNFLVTFTEGAATAAPDLRGRLVTAGGVPTGAAFDISVAAGAQSQSAASFVGGNFAVIWANNDNGLKIYGTRVSPAGAVLDTNPETGTGGVPLAASRSAHTQPDLGCGASGCLLAWTDRAPGTSAFGVGKMVLGADLVPVTGVEEVFIGGVRDARAPAVAAAGDAWVASWQDGRHGGPDAVMASRFDPEGQVVDPEGILVVTGNSRQSAPAAAENGANWFVSWSDSRELGADIRGLRVRFTGANQDAASRGIATAAAHQGAPDAARMGTGNVIVWNDARNGEGDDVFATRLDTSGNPIDGSGVEITSRPGDQIAPEVASDGTSALVVWQDREPGNFDIIGALFGPGGVVVAQIPICVGPGDATSPSVAYDPASGLYLVASSSRDGAGVAQVRGTLVTAAGQALGNCDAVIAPGPAAQLDPDVTFGGGRFFVTWEDRRSENLGDIFGARVTATAAGITVLDPAGLAITTATGAQTAPVAAFAQSSYLVAWTDGRDAGLSSTDIYGGQVSTTGLVGADYAISTAPEAEASPSMSATAGGSSALALVAYTRAIPELETARVFHRRVTAGPVGGTTCNSNAQCDSGFCVDGRCCDSACGGGNPNDCQACSTARGAAQDGVCGPVAAGRICRGYATPFCDVRERCDGASLECPEDLGRREGRVCDDETGGVCPANDVSGAPHFCALPTPP